MSQIDKKKQLQDIQKETDIHVLLDEILAEIGYDDVKVTHENGSRPEFGKDLIASRFDDIDEKKIWSAFVVKKGAVSGNSSMINEISNQVEECFEYPYESIELKQNLHINNVKVVTNMHLSSGAKDKIKIHNKLKQANIDFWDGDKIIRLIDKHYPKYWLKGSKQYKKYIEKFEDLISKDSAIKSLGLQDDKIQRILNNFISPKLEEYYENEEGEPKTRIKETNSVINFPDNSIIVGQPGSGKSTLIKELSKEIIQQNSLRNNFELYPIILSFRVLKDSGFNFEKSIKAYFSSSTFSEISIDSSRIFEQGNYVLFIDALDEIGNLELREEALLNIAIFKEEHPEIKIICTSRPADFLLDASKNLDFKYFDIGSMNREQIENYINNYFFNNEVKSKRLLKSLKDSGILEKLPKTPLTLSLITVLFDENEVEIPATITDLYTMFTELLLGKSQFKDGIEIIEITIKHRLLSVIAFYMQESNQVKVNLSEVHDVIAKFKDDRGHKYDVENVLSDLVGDNSLLIQDDSLIQFKHLSFQEYYAANEVYNFMPEKRNLLVENFSDLWWQNVTTFYGGFSKDAPALINEIIASHDFSNTHKNLSYTAGMGYLLQVLYNTPTKNRYEGLKSSIEAIIKSIDQICCDKENENSPFRKMSMYSLLLMFKLWFQHNHKSITLIDPFRMYFDNHFEVDFLTQSDKKEKSVWGYKLLLSQSVLATEDFMDFSNYSNLLKNSTDIDVSVMAAVEMHFRIEKMFLTKIQKRNEEFKKIEKLRKKVYNKILQRKSLVNSSIDELALSVSFLTEGVDKSEEE